LLKSTENTSVKLYLG